MTEVTPRCDGDHKNSRCPPGSRFMLSVAACNVDLGLATGLVRGMSTRQRISTEMTTQKRNTSSISQG